MFAPNAAAQVPEASALIAEARVAYRAGPFAERISIDVTDAIGRRESAAIVVRAEPRGTGVGSILLELPSMRVWSGSDGIVAVGSRETGAWWGVEAAGDPMSRLSDVLPPVVSPGLAIAMGREDWTPVTPSIKWSSVTEAPSGGGWVLGGVSDEFALQATIDRETARLVHVEVSGPSSGPLVQLSIAIERLEPGDPGDWKPQTEGLDRRGNLAELMDRKPTIVPGDLFPAVGWVRADGRSWRLSEATEPGSAGQSQGSIGASLVVLFRAERETAARASILRDVRLGIEAARAALRGRVRDRVVAGDRGHGVGALLVPAAVFDGAGFEAERFESIVAEMGDLALDSPGLVWTMPGRRTIDAIAPGSQSVMCVIDRGGYITRVIVLDGAEARSEQLRAEIAGAILDSLPGS